MLILGLLVLAVASVKECRTWSFCGHHPEPLQTLPSIVLWAWEHNDSLSFVDPSKVAVAYYAGTIMLGRENATLTSRQNKLDLRGDAVAFPVFRIQNAHSEEPASSESWSAAKRLICEYVQKHGKSIIQIDCDAGLHDRHGYKRFLTELKSALPKDSCLSITALASWCLADKWLQTVPADETVAMMFSLGKRRNETISVLARDGLSPGNRAVESLGIAVNEEETTQKVKELGCIKRASRIYVFSPLGWTKRRYERVLSDLQGER
jgi:hypothetical protein